MWLAKTQKANTPGLCQIRGREFRTYWPSVENGSSLVTQILSAGVSWVISFATRRAAIAMVTRQREPLKALAQHLLSGACKRLFPPGSDAEGLAKREAELGWV